jgi:hypothetical protein
VAVPEAIPVDLLKLIAPGFSAQILHAITGKSITPPQYNDKGRRSALRPSARN